MTAAHILVVDDDERIRRAIATWLGVAGYHVMQAADGKTAIDLLERTEYAVVITDIVMGEVDGIEVLYTARTMPSRPSVILLTGYGSLETAVAAVRAGAHDYLLKPCDGEVLLECVAAAIKRHQMEQRLREASQILAAYTHGNVVGAEERGVYRPNPTMLRVGLLTIGTTRRQVWFDSRLVQLTPIEYSLLWYLAERPAQVHRYSTIVRYTHQLDLDDVEAKGLLRTHFLNLRKKIDPGYFTTDRGIGYMLTVPTQDMQLEPER